MTEITNADDLAAESLPATKPPGKCDHPRCRSGKPGRFALLDDGRPTLLMCREHLPMLGVALDEREVL